MGFLRSLFSGFDDLLHDIGGGVDDLRRGDFSGFDDRAHDALYTVKENPALDTVAGLGLDLFTGGLGSKVMDAAYNKSKYGHSFFNFKDFAKGQLAGDLAGGFLGGLGFGMGGNTSLLGVGKNALYGAAKGGLTQGILGESMEDGAKSGALSGGFSSLVDYAGSGFDGVYAGKEPGSLYGTTSSGDKFSSIVEDTSMPDVGTLGGTMRDASGENSYDYGERVPSQAQKEANNSVYESNDGGYMPSSMKNASEIPLGSGTGSNPVTDLLSAFTSGTGANGSGPSYLDLAGNALGAYSAYQQRRRIKEQLQTLKDMYSENSPYAQRLRSQLDRRAAQTGRRSQVGSRQTQLQALLAEAAMRNQPQTAQLLGLQDEQRRRMAGNLIQGASRLGSMFPTTPRPQQQTVPSFDGLGSLSNYWPQ